MHERHIGIHYQDSCSCTAVLCIVDLTSFTLLVPIITNQNSLEFGEHWLQRLSLVLARGQGDLVLEAVKTARKNHRGRDGGRGASAEWSQTDCQPCVSLA